MVRVSRQQGVPVITVDGEVVVGFDQRRLIELLERSQPKLGASVADVAARPRQVPGMPKVGAFVGQVRPGSPAARAGLQRGDVIIRLDGQAVSSAEDLHRLVSRYQRGRDVRLTVVRDGIEQVIPVRL